MRWNVVFWAFFFGLALGLPWRAQAQFSTGGPSIGYRVLSETGAARPGSVHRVAVVFTLDEGWHVNAHEPLEEFLIPTALSLVEDSGFSAAEVAYPKHELISLAFSPDKPMAVYEHEFTVGLAINVPSGAARGEMLLKGALRYQACNDKMCAPPKDLPFEFSISVGGAGEALSAEDAAIFSRVAWPGAGATVEADGGAPAPATATEQSEGEACDALLDRFAVTGKTGFASQGEFLAFIDGAESGDAGAADENKFRDKSWGLVVAIVLAGGLLLNLTPCVLPLIPINIAIIGAGARAGSRGRGFALGSAYGLGISLVYGLLGLAVVLGISTAFGSINATVWFNASIAVLFVFLGLAMFDVINIDFSRFQTEIGLQKNEKGSFFIAFSMGSVSALLAGACVAPVVIYTIVYAQDQYSQGVKLALLLPFLLGVGMALPWPFAGAGLSVMPKPGAWMVRVKQAFGVFIFLFAAYYGHMAYGLMKPAGSLAVQEEGWENSLCAGLARAEAEGKPVFVDFWATWCKNCLVMDKTVLKDEEVLDRLDGYVRIKFQAENPEAPETSALLKRYGVFGLPAYLILQPSGGAAHSAGGPEGGGLSAAKN